MRKLLFALVMMVTGAFAFGGATPASAMAAAPVAGMSDVVKADSAMQQVTYYRYGYRRFCWKYPDHPRCYRRRWHRHYRHDYWRPRHRDHGHHGHHRRHRDW
jgi:hypothetical protein